jgi:uncharacterized membrane protein YccC
MMIFVKEPHILLVIMFASMVMSYSLLLFNYTASVVFTSSYVLLMFHLLAPGSLHIIGERAIDTVVGCAIAIAASHLFPYWEYRLMGKLVNDMISATRQYLEASWWWSGKPVNAGATIQAAAVTEAGARVPAVALAQAPMDGGAAVLSAGVASEAAVPGVAGVSTRAATAAAAATPAAAAAATALDRDFRYRLARKNVHVAFANLGQAFQRMMLEPKTAQKFVPELNDLLVRSHVLASQITAAAPLLRTSAEQLEGISLQPLQRALTVVRENLAEAEAGTAPPPDQADRTRQLTRELDAMVVEAEQSPDYPAESIHELKLLAHQCKQMVAASYQIRRNAGVIRLPED